MRLNNNFIEKFKIAILAVVALSFVIATVPAGAQQPPQGAPPPPPGPGMFDAFGFQGFQAGLGGKTVTSSPFSATFSVQTTQTLADGNQIQRNTTGSLARDSQGRTRRDMALPGIGQLGASGQTAPRAVFINDNVAGAEYMLDPSRKIATKMQLPSRGNRAGEPPPSGQGGPPRFGGPGQGGPGQGNQKDMVTTSLGTQTINGVLAEGTRYTRTIPVGAIGNQNPILITTERWYSADLQTVVMTKRTDPRMGETVSQLTNIQRNEPDPSLFQVPSEYTIKQGGGPGFGGGRRGRGPNGGPGGAPGGALGGAPNNSPVQ